MSTLYSIGLMNQLGDALESAGFSPDDVTKLRTSGKLGEMKNVVYGMMEIKPVENIIDCSADPFCPDGWTVEEHRKAGQLEWNPAKVKLFLDLGQQNGRCLKGHDLREAIKNQPVLNACVLDWLLAHPKFIPENWKGKYVFFWGTIYRGSDGHPYVRYLDWRGDRWDWDCRWLGGGWLGDGPAVLSAST